MNDAIYKYGVIWNYYDSIFCEYIKDGSLLKFDYIVEYDRIGISYGCGNGKIKYCKNGELIKIEKNGWFSLPVIEVQITPGSHYNHIVKISDPKGEIREIHSESDSIMKDVNPDYLFPFYKINQLAKYVDWSHFDLITENIELKKRVEELEVRIHELEK